MMQPTSCFLENLETIVANCQLNLKWVAYSKDCLTAKGAQVLVRQWGIFTRHSRRCWAYVVGNCPQVELRKFIVTENLYEEEALEGHSHFDLVLRMGQALGLSREEIESAVPLPTTSIALLAWETLTKNRSWFEGAAAKAVLEMTNNQNCGNFSALEAERWMRQLKLSCEDAEFWLLHDSVDKLHGNGAVTLMEKYLETQIEREAALQAARESMLAWRIYLDGIYDAAVAKEN